MPRASVKTASTGITDTIFVRDTSQTSAVKGLTALAYNTASLTLYYRREGSNADVAVTLATATLGTWTSGGFIQIDATNMPGQYEIGYPNAAVAAGAKYVTFTLRGATNMEDVSWTVELTATDTQNATSGGIINLDTNVASRMPTFALPANFGTLLITAGGAVTVNSNSDKTGYFLDASYNAAKTAAQAGDAMTLNGAALTAVAAAVEGHLIDEADGQQLLAAIVAKINSTDVNLAGLSTTTIAAAVWAFLLSNMTTPNSGGAALASIFGKLPANAIADETILAAAIGNPMQAGSHVVVSGFDVGALTATAIASGALNGKGDWSTATALASFVSAYTAPDNTDIQALATMLEVDPSHAGKKRLTSGAVANVAGGGGGGGGSSVQWNIRGSSVSTGGR